MTVPLYVETGSLWSLNALVDPTQFHEPRWPLYFAHLADYLTNPHFEPKCLLPTQQRQDAPLPVFYRAMDRLQLMGHEVIPAEFLAPSPADLERQFAEFSVHAKLDTPSMRSWFDFHTTAPIAPGWQRAGIPSDASWQGVHPLIREWLETSAPAELDVVASCLSLDRPKAALAFQFIQRGWPYHKYAVEVRGGHYLPHQVRWQVARDVAAVLPTPVFGIVLGGVLLELVREHQIRRDAEAISEFLLKVRMARRSAEDQVRDVTNEDQAYEVLAAILPGIVGGKLADSVEVAVRIAVGTVLELCGLPIQSFGLAYWVYAVATALFAGTVPIRLSPREARIFRRFMDYHAVGLNVEDACGICGARRRNGVCVVCIDRQRRLSQARRP